jgi:hypothetical protein
MVPLRRPRTFSYTLPGVAVHRFADRRALAGATGQEAAQAILSAAAEEGVDLERITGELEHEGVTAFCDSYDELAACIESKLGSLIATS